MDAPTGVRFVPCIEPKNSPCVKTLKKSRAIFARLGRCTAAGFEKYFFEDGNAFVVKSEVLIELTRYCHQIHPNLKKVSSCAHAKDIIKKSDDELKRLADAGFTMVLIPTMRPII
jgi:hypothetical protein